MSTTVNIGKIGIVPKGEWNNITTYEHLDLVIYDGLSYLAKQDVPANILPTNIIYWQKLVEGSNSDSVDNNSDIPGETTTDVLNNISEYLINENLIPNGWFKVNSTGYINYRFSGDPEEPTPETNYTTTLVTNGQGYGNNVYCLDNWQMLSNHLRLTVVNKEISANIKETNYIAIQDYQTNSNDEVGISQLIDHETLLNNNLTLSILYATNSDGPYQYKSNTVYFNENSFPNKPNTGTAVNYICLIEDDNNKILARIRCTTSSSEQKQFRIRLYGYNDTIYYKAIKLEFGKISTLKYDLEPSFASEVAKLEHYYFDKTQYYTFRPPENMSSPFMYQKNHIVQSYEIGKTYLENTNRFFYGTPSFLGYNQDTNTYTPVTGRTITKDGSTITQFPAVCGTFIQLILAGVPFNNCRISRGTISGTQLTGGTNQPLIGCCNFDLTNPILKYYYYPTPGHYQLYCNELAKLLNDNGLLYPIKTRDDIRNLQPGDILFFGSPKASILQRWQGLSHTELFLGFFGANYNNNPEVWGKSLGINDPGSSDDNVVKYRDWRLSTIQQPLDGVIPLKYFARFPNRGFEESLANLFSQQHYKNVTINQSGIHYATTGGTVFDLPVTLSLGNTERIFIQIDENLKLENQRAYTIILQLNGVLYTPALKIQPMQLSNTYYYLAGSSSIIYTDPSKNFFMNYGEQGSSSKTGIYSCVIVPGSSNDLYGFEIEIQQPNSQLSNASAKIEKIWVYDKLVAP